MEIKFDTVEFLPKQFNMPKMSYIDATFYATQNLIYSLQNPEPTSQLSKLVNGHKEVLRTLAEILSKSSPPAIPLRVRVKEIIQEKPKKVNQKIAQLKSTFQATPSINTKPLRVHIVKAYP